MGELQCAGCVYVLRGSFSFWLFTSFAQCPAQWCTRRALFPNAWIMFLATETVGGVRGLVSSCGSSGASESQASVAPGLGVRATSSNVRAIASMAPRMSTKPSSSSDSTRISGIPGLKPKPSCDNDSGRLVGFVSW